jgi:hypothetical protein
MLFFECRKARYFAGAIGGRKICHQAHTRERQGVMDDSDFDEGLEFLRQGGATDFDLAQMAFMRQRNAKLERESEQSMQQLGVEGITRRT